MRLSKLANEITQSLTLALREDMMRYERGEVKYTPPHGLPSMKKAVIYNTEESCDRKIHIGDKKMIRDWL
jgi:hypothetical protein